MATTVGHPIEVPPGTNGSPPNLQSIDPAGISSSQQKRQDGLGTTVRATSSAGNSISSRSLKGNGSRNGSGGKEGAFREAMSPERSQHIRTLPTWVQRREEDDNDVVRFPPMVLRRPPQRSAHDAQRENTPVTPSPPSQSASRWRNFVEGTAAYPPNTSYSEKDWLAEQPDLNSPWLAHHQDPENEGEGSADDQRELFGKKKRRIWYKQIHIMLLNSPMVPLTFRSIIWLLSLLALSFASSIFHMSDAYNIEQKASTIMAIVVDAIALMYLIYITYDEYSGKPLGLRSPTAKIRLLMFDLVFIVFDSANLSLAFDTLFDVRWSCRSTASTDIFQPNTSATHTIEPICDRQRALAAFLFLALCAWIATFTLSVFRVVERVSSAR
ncbi:hypothetical protein BDD12DRAFT_813904 [Trichophaea hybrida]|nr:hypothetical protein BDD12DRAFT_813904 [Trichophaea hybrida]